MIASSGPLSGLDGLAFDPFSGDLFVSTHLVNPVSGRQGIYELSLQPGSFLHATLITSSAFPTTFNPDGIEPDGEGNVYVASLVRRVTKSTSTTSPPGNDGPHQHPPWPRRSGAPAGTGGHSVPDYWFFEETADKFGMPSTRPPVTSPRSPYRRSANPQVDGITAGPGGTVWFTEFNTNRIGMIDTDTDKITEFPVTTPVPIRTGSWKVRTATSGSPRRERTRSGGSTRRLTSSRSSPSTPRATTRPRASPSGPIRTSGSP